MCLENFGDLALTWSLYRAHEGCVYIAEPENSENITENVGDVDIVPIDEGRCFVPKKAVFNLQGDYYVTDTP